MAKTVKVDGGFKDPGKPLTKAQVDARLRKVKKGGAKNGKRK